MPALGLNSISLHYESYGTGSVILGIHGTPSSALLWHDAAMKLALRGRCVIYDRRGFGRSSRPQPFESVNLSEHVEDAAALLDALSASPAAVIGRSTGGLIALELAHRRPEKVEALVLLEPALFTLDPDAAAWAKRLRERVLRAAAQQPELAGEVVIRETLGDQGWDSMPQELRLLFTAAGPAVLAEIRGRGLDLSEEALELTHRHLTAIAQPTLLVSAEDSPEVLRRINDRLAEALPNAETALVGGGHLIDPATPSSAGVSDPLRLVTQAVTPTEPASTHARSKDSARPWAVTRPVTKTWRDVSYGLRRVRCRVVGMRDRVGRTRPGEG